MNIQTKIAATATLTSILIAAMCSVSAAAPAAFAPLLDPLFTDHVVLQRERAIALTGRTEPGALVRVMLGFASSRARADASGRWRAVLPAQPAGGPFQLTARTDTGANATANDVLVGDVFVCSGQSNMALPVNRVGDSRNEIEISTNATIRMATVEPQASAAPLESYPQPLAWQLAGPTTVPEWSAACFFFARELQKTTHVPIGLVHASYSGSRIEPWLTATGLRSHGRDLSSLALLELYAGDRDAGQHAFAIEWEKWWRGKSGDTPGTEPWAVGTGAGTADSGSWKLAPAALGNWQRWGVHELADYVGELWFRTTVRVSAAQATTAATLALGPINQIDETWVNGRAIGNTFGYGEERNYHLAPGVLHAGDNLVVVNVMSTYQGGGLLADAARRAVRFADGTAVPLEGWQYRVVPQAFGYPPGAPWQSVGGLTSLYNAMIAPLGQFGVRAVIWYQGESNTDQALAYQPLLAELMSDWRRQLGANLPFLIVQLPNYGPPPLAPAESDWATLREAQRRAVLSDRKAALAVTIDIGEPRNLHPTDKQDVGVRLARAARHLIYREPITPSGPVPLGAARRAGEVTIAFGDIEGRLVAYGNDAPIGFELCGVLAGSCRYAQARLDGAHVILAVPNGGAASRVRYCWAASPVCTLYDLSGLPAGPFEIAVN